MSDPRFETQTVEDRLRKYCGGVGLEAASVITVLRAEVEMLRDLLDIAVDDHDSSMGRSNVPAHWSNRARAALTQTKDTTDDA